MLKRIFQNVRSSSSSSRLRRIPKTRRSHQKNKLHQSESHDNVLVSESPSSSSSITHDVNSEDDGSTVHPKVSDITTATRFESQSEASSSSKIVVIGGVGKEVVEEQEEGSSTTASTTSASSSCSSSSGEGSSSNNDRNVLDTAILYRQLGSEMDETGNYDKAKEYLEFALSILQEQEWNHTKDNHVAGTQEVVAQEQEGEICLMLGHIMYKTEDYRGAIEKFSKAREMTTLRLINDDDDDDSINSKLEEIEYLIEMATMMMGD